MKERLHLEEKYRAEVRKQLEAASQGSSDKLSKFLNSSFGLWVLSAIFISGAGTIYQNWQKSVDAEKATFQQRLTEESINRQAIERLDIEISFRLSQALLQLSVIAERVSVQLKDKSADERTLAVADATFGVLQNLASALRNDREALYSEHSGYSLPTLLAELRRRLPEANRAEVERSLAALAGVANSTMFSSGGSIPEQTASILLEKVVLNRWKGTAFHHIDCSSKTPFC
ncbi:MAG: hypothetical protein ABL970_09715 [Nitrospira sp.]